MGRFLNRKDAGQKLAQKLQAYTGRTDVIVLALPRGGVPGREELAMGAIASGGFRVLNEDLIRAREIPGQVVDRVARREQQELERHEQAYRGSRPRPEIRGRTVILIDDGLATGASMRAAVAGIRAQNPAYIVVAVPTAAIESCQMFQSDRRAGDAGTGRPAGTGVVCEIPASGGGMAGGVDLSSLVSPSPPAPPLKGGGETEGPRDMRCCAPHVSQRVPALSPL